jgi:hypothetical protein
MDSVQITGMPPHILRTNLSMISECMERSLGWLRHSGKTDDKDVTEAIIWLQGAMVFFDDLCAYIDLEGGKEKEDDNLGE